MDGLTPRQEAFAAGLATGLSQADAYRKAYPAAARWKDQSVWVEASKLAPKVSQRVSELRAKAVAANEFTVEQHLRDLLALRDEARAVEQFGPAIKAEESRGKCAGFYTERHEHTVQVRVNGVVRLVPRKTDAGN